MQITLRRTGGFAGITLVTTLREEELTAEQREAVRLVATREKSGDHSANVPGMPDGFIYELELSGDTGTVFYKWSEEHLPPSIRPLFSALKRR